MARRKKDIDKDKKEYVHSKYQVAIFDYIKHGQGHLVVEASAGSGKTYTIVKSLEFIPSDKSILVTAFNKDIVNELKKKTKSFDNVTAMTMHGLGLRMLSMNFGKSPKIDDFKYIAYIKNNLYKMSRAYLSLGRAEKLVFSDNVKKYVNFGRFYLCTCEKDLELLDDRYSIDNIADEKKVAMEIMEWGKDNMDVVDFTDMIWLPNILNLNPMNLKFDFIMVDECQDMNRAERELVLKCHKMGTRMCSVGDRNQMLYGFSGADPESFDALCSIPNTKILPLSISYRCGKNIVKFAQTVVPSIEEDENNIDGQVINNVKFDDIKEGDMVLCRNNAPLVVAYMQFLSQGKSAFIRGKEMGTKMKGYVKGFDVDLINLNTLKDGLDNRMYNDFLKELYKIMDNYSINEHDAITNSASLTNKLDMILTIEALSKGLTTTKELVDKIDKIFGNDDKSESGIALSTIHKAKGLEAENVYIVCRDLMPSKSAKLDWEMRQEKNLEYVAYTRAKKTLGFVTEDKLKNVNPYNEISVTALKEKEVIVEKLYGTVRYEKVTSKNASRIAKSARELKKIDLSLSGRNKTVSIDAAKKTSSGIKSVIRTKRKKITTI